MGMWVVQQFSVRETDRAQALAALKAISEHIKAEHPEIQAVRARVQWMGSRSHRSIVWEEQYESLTELEAAPATQTCADVWAPVHALTLPGTHERSVLMDADLSWRRSAAQVASTTVVEEEIATG
jgi:hypothetical protein